MGNLVLAGATSGSITLEPTAVAGTTTLTLPAANGTVITTGSSGQSIPKAALPTGSVLQVVNATQSTEVSTSTNVYVDTGLSASITPIFSTSKILILISQNGVLKETNNTGVNLKIVRNSTDLLQFTNGAAFTNNNNSNNTTASACYLDNPSTTSSITYKTQFASQNNNAIAKIQQFGSCASTITLMEIAA